tara:strand:- start:432 stop:773 length:342 start_codon:yes stop_codon:yes gene_type:complete
VVNADPQGLYFPAHLYAQGPSDSIQTRLDALRLHVSIRRFELRPDIIARTEKRPRLMTRANNVFYNLFYHPTRRTTPATAYAINPPSPPRAVTRTRALSTRAHALNFGPNTVA